MNRRVFLSAFLAGLVSGCARFRDGLGPYAGPEVTRIVVLKARRRMYLLHNDEVLRGFDIELGFQPEGPKAFLGDGRTPEGRYSIDRRNPNSAYTLSLGLSYPNRADRAFATAQGHSPGGDIFIHGTPHAFRRQPDWTHGCIAVRDRDMRVIYQMVGMGTVVDIYP